ncbi:MAG: hypothetical protein J0L99_16945 [Chitinophagales bacterium]|nr:hypothetical protein [Chitinophagales bacterium]
MTHLRTGITLLLLLLGSSLLLAQKTPKVAAKDFNALIGSWQGSLTYLDYSSGKPYTMPANVAVKRIGKTNSFIFSNSYPDEMSANSADTLHLSADGQFIGTARVKSRTKLANGTLEIVTEEAGLDGNDDQPATLRLIYSISPSTFVMRKEVQFTGTTNWIKRHEYVYKKNEIARK